MAWCPLAEQVVAPLAKCGSRIRGFAPYQQNGGFYLLELLVGLARWL
jgi:hypothetical protein